jgi:Papain family cysteine protease
MNHSSCCLLIFCAQTQKTGPFAVGLNGGSDSFLSYAGGIYSNPTCKHGANHAMLVVGYGEETDRRTGHVIKYWIARNSWGKAWVGIFYNLLPLGDATSVHSHSFLGFHHLTKYYILRCETTQQGEDGYVRVARGQGKGGVCGLEKSPSVALGGVLVGNHRLKKYRNYVSFKTREYRLRQSSLQQDSGNAILDKLNTNSPSLTVFCERIRFSSCVQVAAWYPQHKPLCFGLSAMAVCAAMALWLMTMDGRAQQRRRQRHASESSSASRPSQHQHTLSQSALSQHESSPLLDASASPSYTVAATPEDSKI